jgi:hypothetical protein
VLQKHAPQVVRRPMVQPIKRHDDAPPLRANGHAHTEVGPMARKILDAIHSAYPLSLSYPAAALRAGASKRSSQYRDYEKQVLASGEVENDDGRLRSAPGYASPVPVGGDPVENWAGRLTPSYAKMLKAVAAAPRGIDRDQIAEVAGVSPTSSGLGAGLRELQDLALIENRDGVYQLSEGLR